MDLGLKDKCCLLYTSSRFFSAVSSVDTGAACRIFSRSCNNNRLISLHNALENIGICNLSADLASILSGSRGTDKITVYRCNYNIKQLRDNLTGFLNITAVLTKHFHLNLLFLIFPSIIPLTFSVCQLFVPEKKQKSLSSDSSSEIF